jgi:hypothetical protein
MSKKNKKTANPLVKVLVKMSVLTLLVGSLIFYIDYKGYFNPNKSNDHTLKKWNSFYELTDKNTEIDVMLFGNSHLYTGINPKNLSLALGANAFLFAAPGTSVSDSYFGIKEALKKSKPKLIILETYGINEFNNYEFKDGALSDQFGSFSARKDFTTKLISTPYLFAVDNYLYAWSTTIRNHDYLFNNQKQLEENKTLINKRVRRHKKKKLYLGRFVRFTTGIEDSILNRYDSLGAPVNGKDYSYSKYAVNYVDKIVELCKKENIELMFLTLPMYEEHISNYEVWRKKLSEILKKYPNKWLNMQKRPGYNGFDAFAFENTYKENQHMTYKGSLLATYKLVDFIGSNLNVNLPERDKHEKWHNLFYNEEGYFENYNPRPSDKKNKVVSSHKVLNEFTINSCLWLDITNKKQNKIVLKVDKESLKDKNYKSYKIRLLIKFELNGQEKMAQIDLVYDLFHQLENEVVFISYVRPLNIIELVDGAILKRPLNTKR